MVMEVVEEEVGESTMMQCTGDHNFKNVGSSPGGICAICLQDKLGKLVSSSFPAAVFPSSSSPSPSFRSEFGNSASNIASSSSTSSHVGVGVSSACECDENHTKRSKLPFLLSHGKKKKKEDVAANKSRDARGNIVFQRSKSTAICRRGLQFPQADDHHSHGKRRFWSFLSLPSAKHSSTKKSQNANISTSPTKNEELVVIDEENISPSPTDNKVSRSRSIGCGSRSFSGDLFERISTGFGDCAVRRVESHREGNNSNMHSMHRKSVTGGEFGERVKCGGIFRGFAIASSLSSSSWLSSGNEDNFDGKRAMTPGRYHVRGVPHAGKAGRLQLL